MLVDLAFRQPDFIARLSILAYQYFKEVSLRPADEWFHQPTEKFNTAAGMMTWLQWLQSMIESASYQHFLVGLMPAKLNFFKTTAEAFYQPWLADASFRSGQGISNYIHM